MPFSSLVFRSDDPSAARQSPAARECDWRALSRWHRAAASADIRGAPTPACALVRLRARLFCHCPVVVRVGFWRCSRTGVFAVCVEGSRPDRIRRRSCAPVPPDSPQLLAQCPASKRAWLAYREATGSLVKLLGQGDDALLDLNEFLKIARQAPRSLLWPNL